MCEAITDLMIRLNKLAIEFRKRERIRAVRIDMVCMLEKILPYVNVSESMKRWQAVTNAYSQLRSLWRST